MLNRTTLKELYECAAKFWVYVDNAESKKLNKALFEVIRKLALANELNSKRVISVAGLQGAGKTTLLSTMYNIEGNISIGRGEKLPVFVTEKKDCTAPKYYVVGLVKTEESYEPRHREVSSIEEFVNAGKDDDSSENILYLEIEVPFMHTHNEEISFMLLPGFEKQKSSWQNLIDFAMNSSDSVVFVMTESGFSSQQNAEHLETIKEKFKTATYVFTHAKDMDENKKESLRDSCMEKQGIPDPCRVVFSDVYSSDEENKVWIDSLKKSLDFYTNGSECVLKGRNYISNIVDECEDILYEIEENLRDLEDEKVVGDLKNIEYIKVFDKQVERFRKNYQNAILKEFSSAADMSTKKFENKWKENSKKEFLKNLQQKFLGQNPKDFMELKEKITDSFESEEFYNGRCNGIQYAFTKAITELVKRDNSNYIYIKNTYTDLLQIDRKVYDAITDKNSKDEEAVSILKEKENKALSYRDDISLLMTGKAEHEFKNDIIKTFEVLVDIAAYNFCVQNIHTLIPCFDGAELPVDITQTGISSEEINSTLAKINETSGAIKDTFEGLRNNVLEELESSSQMSSTTKTLAVAGATAAIDFIPDQTINLIPAIATSLGMSAETAAATAGVGAAVVIAGVFAVSITKDVNKLLVKDFFDCEQAIGDIYNNESKKLMDDFDRYFDDIRDKIGCSLISLSGTNQGAVDLLNQRRFVSQMKTKLRDIKKDISNNYDLHREIGG